MSFHYDLVLLNRRLSRNHKNQKCWKTTGPPGQIVPQKVTFPSLQSKNSHSPQAAAFKKFVSFPAERGVSTMIFNLFISFHTGVLFGMDFVILMAFSSNFSFFFFSLSLFFFFFFWTKSLGTVPTPGIHRLDMN